jgi:hypothetical protein
VDVTIDERLEAITMNLELASRDIEDLRRVGEERAEQNRAESALVRLELNDMRDSINILATATNQLVITMQASHAATEKALATQREEQRREDQKLGDFLASVGKHVDQLASSDEMTRYGLRDTAAQTLRTAEQTNIGLAELRESCRDLRIAAEAQEHRMVILERKTA